MTLLDFVSSNWLVQLSFCIVSGALIALVLVLRATREKDQRLEAAKPADFLREMQKTKETIAARERELAMKLSVKNEAVTAISNN